MNFAAVFAATEVGSLRGVLTVIGTLAFVGLCFVFVELLDRRGGAAATPAAASRSHPGSTRIVAPAAVAPAAVAPASAGLGGSGGPGAGVTAFADDVPADDIWPLHSERSVGAVERGLPSRTQSLAISAGGSVVAVLVALALIPLRDRVGLASVALALVLVVVAAAALGGRVAAAVTSAAAALSFNFMHTTPLYNFHIASTANIVTSILMIVIGISVGEVAVRSFRTRALDPPAS